MKPEIKPLHPGVARSIENRNWSGTLNEANVAHVASAVRRLLVGARFTIASVEGMDRPSAFRPDYLPSVSLRTDCVLNSEWTDKKEDPVRLWPGEQVPAREGMKSYWREAHFSFSAGGYYWCGIGTAPGAQDDHEDYLYACVEFNRDYRGDWFAFTSRAPAGKGYLHKHLFAVQNK